MKFVFTLIALNKNGFWLALLSQQASVVQIMLMLYFWNQNIWFCNAPYDLPFPEDELCTKFRNTIL